MQKYMHGLTIRIYISVKILIKIFVISIILLISLVFTPECRICCAQTAMHDDYPIIKDMEIRVLGRYYSDEDIYDRLNKLETTLYGKNSAKPLSDRVDDLKSTVFGNIPSDNNDNTALSTEVSLNNLLNELENELFKVTYPNETVEERVSRLEKSIFDSSSESYPVNERLERISAVVKAKPSGELNKDMAQLRTYQSSAKGLTLLAIILMIIAGAAF